MGLGSMDPVTVIDPHPGPQTAFLASQADIAVYGGAAGVGKGTMLVLDPLRHCHTPGFRGVIFRRNQVDLTVPGSILDTARDIYGKAGGRLRERPERGASWGGATIDVTHIGDAARFYGHSYAYMGFDDLPEFGAAQFWGMLTRNRSTCGVRPYVRASTLPCPDGWVRELLDWWIGEDGLPIAERSGVLRYLVRVGIHMYWGDTAEEAARGTSRHPSEAYSVTFISATLGDNPTLADDRDYVARLGLLSGPERKRLVEGNWNAR